MERNRLLEKQIQKHLTGEDLANERIQQFINAVNESYQSYEKDKELNDHAFLITDTEYKEIYQRLKNEITIRTDTIEKLKNAVRNIQVDEDTTLSNDKDDLPLIISYLDQQITKRKEIEKELLAAKETAEASTLAKEIFLANMSHEIRTPMNAILGMANQLNKTPLSENQSFYLTTIQTAADNLLNIINDILDLSKVESGRLSLEIIGFDPRQTIERSYDVMKHRAEEKGLGFTFSFCDPALEKILLGDPYRLNQILLNLISNAIKFTHKGQVNITCRVLENNPASQKIEITVSDTGIGMDEEFMKNLFQKFIQEDSSYTRKFGGTGLGMSICKYMIDLMDGEIHVNSKKGKGTAVSCIINFKKGTEADLPHEDFIKVNTNILAGKKILVTDDNEMNRLVATTILKNYGAFITEAQNGMEAIEKLKQTEFDIILMDIQMPVMDGMEATQIIRKTFNQTIPIIALTAFAIKGDNVKFLEAGLNDYLSKPFEEHHLLEVICGWLGKGVPAIEMPQPHAATASPGYDLSKLVEMSRGDLVFIEKMKQLFIQQANKSIQEFSEAYAADDFDRIKKIAHRIKPTIDSMCIEGLKKEIREIESSAMHYGKSEKLSALLKHFETVITQVIGHITPTLSANTAD
jgi:signal transduction histidine kinase/CheY-like chemotaxis protein/HPt (histidine-containing phosphotransfer) domain-containing protein